MVISSAGADDTTAVGGYGSVFGANLAIRFFLMLELDMLMVGFFGVSTFVSVKAEGFGAGDSYCCVIASVDYGVDDAGVEGD